MKENCKHENEVEERFKHPISGTEVHVRCVECGLLLGAGEICSRDITANFAKQATGNAKAMNKIIIEMKKQMENKNESV